MFQKNLVVWKLCSMVFYPPPKLSFRRTQQCGNVIKFCIGVVIFSWFQKNLVVWKRSDIAPSFPPAPVFQKNLVVWKLFEKKSINARFYAFQKNLVVWKLCYALPALGSFFLVSEELSSVETYCPKPHIPYYLACFRRTQQCGNFVLRCGMCSERILFQKNLVVWKLGLMYSYLTTQNARFRRTQQCGNHYHPAHILLVITRFQKNLVVWKRGASRQI